MDLNGGEQGSVCLRRCHCGTTWVGTMCGAVNAVVQVEHAPATCFVLMVKAMVTVDRLCLLGRNNYIEKFSISESVEAISTTVKKVNFLLIRQ